MYPERWFWPMSRFLVRDGVYQQDFQLQRARIAYQLLFYGPLILRDTDWINNLALRRAYAARHSDDALFLAELCRKGLLSLVHRADLDYTHLGQQGGAHASPEEVRRLYTREPEDLCAFIDDCTSHTTYDPTAVSHQFREEVRRLVPFLGSASGEAGVPLPPRLTDRLLDAVDADDGFRWARIGPRGDLTRELCALAKEEAALSPESVTLRLDELGQSAHIHVSRMNAPRSRMIWSDEQLGCRRLLRAVEGRVDDALVGIPAVKIRAPTIHPNDQALALLTSDQILAIRSSDEMEAHRRALALAISGSGSAEFAEASKELVALVQREVYLQMTDHREQQGPRFGSGWITILKRNLQAGIEWEPVYRLVKGTYKRARASGKAMAMFFGAEDPRLQEKRASTRDVLHEVARENASRTGLEPRESFGEATMAEGIVWEKLDGPPKS